MTQKELLTTLKEWQKKKEILEFDTKCLLTHDLNRSSKALSCIGVFACAAYTNRLHLYIYSEETTWLLNRIYITICEMSSQYRTLIAF